MDWRLTPATARVAHRSLRGVVDAAAFTEGEALRVARPLVDLLRDPGGARVRQLWLGAGFTVVDRDRGHAFGFAARDGYCGWLPEAALGVGPEPSHWVTSVGTHLYGEPRVQAAILPALPMGARLRVVGQAGRFAETPLGFVPMSHLRALGDWCSDPVAVAEGFLGTPYLWGGNSRAGLDCSGLAQAAHLACGIAFAGDADLQETVGREIAADEAFRRGDLLFWPGHVALVAGGGRLIHANGHSMSVAYEGIADCVARVLAAEGVPVRSRRRLGQSISS